MSTRPITFIQTTDDQQVSLNLGYVLFLGLMRILVILLEVGCVLAAGFIPINQQLFFELNQQFVMIRTALIVIACIAIAFSIFIYFTSLLNIVNVVRAVPWLLIFLVIDCLTILAFIILGCFACNQEAQVPQNLYGIVYTRSLYAISGVLLFLASIILLIHSYFSLVYLYRLDKFFSQTGPFDQMWRFNKNYCAALGWVRVIILVYFYLLFKLFLTSALIASILINVNSFELYDTQATFYETRTASIILTATALAYSSFLFYASVCNCVNFRFCMAAPWLAIGILYDLIFLAAMITIGIFCAIKETQIPWYDYNFIFRRGAYSVAALFEFLSAIFYMIHIVLSLPYTYRVAGLPKKLSIISLFK